MTKYRSIKAKKAALAVYEDISDRKGLRHVLDEIDEDIIKEMLNKWKRLIAEVYEDDEV